MTASTEHKYLTHPTDVGVVSVGFSGGQGKTGVDTAPTALIAAGLLDSLSADLGYTLHYDNTVHTYTDVIPSSDPPIDNMKRPNTVSNVTKALSEQTYTHAIEGRMVLTLGGDHSIAIGSIGGIAKAIRERGLDDLAVIWVDAHADINTPATSGSGNIHGMPVAFLTGLVKHEVFSWMGEEYTIPLSKLVYIGLRDVDRGEKKILRENKVKAFSMHDVDKWGIGRVMEMALEYIGKDTPIHLSFDVDALDPSHAPSTGTPVRGGLTLREGDYIAESVAETGQLISMDIVEVNPSILTSDKEGDSWEAQETVRAGCSLVRCAFGESLL